MCPLPYFQCDGIDCVQENVNNRQIGQSRGRVVGGSSAINFSVMMYPTKSNWDSWEALGNEGWGAGDLAPYLRKFHTYTAPSDDTAKIISPARYMKAENQGSNGPVPATHPNVYGPFNQAWDETFAKLGWEPHADPILGQMVGAFTCPLSIDLKTGKRGYAVSYYSPNVAARSNLTLLTEAPVEKILLSEGNDGVIATGVQVKTNDGSYAINAKKEVILSAGSLNSPQILELSGIGDKKLLQEHGIPVIIDNPAVGENLQDHPEVTINYEVADNQISGDILRDPKVVEAVSKVYEETRSGPLSGMPVSMAYLPLVDANGAVPKNEVEELLSKYLDNGKTSPALQKQYNHLRDILLNSEDTSTEYLFLPVQLNMRPDHTAMTDVLAKNLPENYVSIMAIHNHPFSRGSVHISSASIDDKPTYDPKYLAHPLDLEIMARQMQYTHRIVNTDPFLSLLKPGKTWPQSASNLDDLEQVKELVKERLFTAFHPAGSCAMLPRDIGGVVDSKCKVYGTKNLRVVDASIYPLEPAGNIQASVYAVAERAADLIKADI